MDDRDISRLFLSVAEHPDYNTRAIREVFTILVKTTLRYRDNVLASRGTTVTVEDVRTVLDWLVPYLANGTLPETENKIRLDLLKLMARELEVMGKPDSL
ncbi:MAG: hypothetical protein SV375_22650 [Thermodesulfobacteriota bacterium]|nr:hypothetical protein [Thermodesulfobacteriota bacterium]